MNESFEELKSGKTLYSEVYLVIDEFADSLCSSVRGFANDLKTFYAEEEANYDQDLTEIGDKINTFSRIQAQLNELKSSFEIFHSRGIFTSNADAEQYAQVDSSSLQIKPTTPHSKIMSKHISSATTTAEVETQDLQKNDRYNENLGEYDCSATVLADDFGNK